MDFRDLLHAADRNKAEASHEASVKRFSTDLPPPKKVSKNGVMSDNIAKFLAKRKAEEAAKAAEARKLKEQLFALRAQNTKNNKKAKIMASRTKDNDFSKIKLTDDEIEAKRKREADIIRQNLSNKVERMKARIEMEEKEKLLPRKRKRKSKTAETSEVQEDHFESDGSPEHKMSSDARHESHSKSSSDRSSQSRKAAPKAAARPAISFAELLKVAEKKQFEPIEIVPKKKEEEKPLTKKEKKILMEEKERERRKKERLLMGDRGILKPNGAVKNNLKEGTPAKREDTKGKPVVIHVERDTRQQNGAAVQNSKPSQKAIPGPSQTKNKPSVESVHGSGLTKSNLKMPVKSNHSADLKRDDKTANVKKSLSKNHDRKNSAPAAQASPAIPVINEDAIAAAIEKRVREKIEKEIEQKLLSKYGLNESPSVSSTTVVNNTPSTSKAPIAKKPPCAVNENGRRPMSKDMIEKMERFMAMKKQAMEQKQAAARPPKKKAFHMNPYLAPPRRLLEPQIRKPPPRRIESSEDEEDDDDLSDFIDDTPSTQNDENYSEYIKELFGYDKSKYLDDDDDAEAMESSFAQQMKEEMESTKAGHREDLEEERKEKERRKRKKLKKN